MRPRVFVSSVMEGFQEYRQAAKEGIISAGAEPVLVEDYPSLPLSPRNACLNGVASCDIYLAIVGERGGWTAPSGKLVVVEEFEEASRRKLRLIAFVQKAKRDEEAELFVAKLSDYVDGVFRVTFTTPAELQSAVKNALLPLIPKSVTPAVNMSDIEEKLKNPHKLNNEAGLRFVITPERVDELIDPVELESPHLERQLNEIAHSAHVELLSYQRPKTSSVDINSITIHQTDDGGRRDIVDDVRLEIATTGMIIIDVNVTGRVSRSQSDFADSMTISEDQITIWLKKCFAFAATFYGARDPFKRYDRMLFNAALNGIGFRKLVPKLPHGSSFSMGQQGDAVVVAFDRPRIVTRADLLKSAGEISAAIAMFRRRLKL